METEDEQVVSMKERHIFRPVTVKMLMYSRRVYYFSKRRVLYIKWEPIQNMPN